MTCGLGKVNFSSRDEAQAQCNSLRKKRNTARVYFCKMCDCYHLTSKKKSKPYDRNKEHRRKPVHRHEAPRGKKKKVKNAKS